MAKRRRTQPAATGKTHGVINGAGEVVEQNIDSTIRENYMPYAMSVILSRAIPEIDGFKPSHRKLLYTMVIRTLRWMCACSGLRLHTIYM